MALVRAATSVACDLGLVELLVARVGEAGVVPDADLGLREQREQELRRRVAADRPELGVEVGLQLAVAVLVELEVDQLRRVVDADVDLDADVARPGADQLHRPLLARFAGVGELELRAHAVLAPHAVRAEPPAGLIEDAAGASRGRSGSRASDRRRGRARSPRSCAAAACCPATRTRAPRPARASCGRSPRPAPSRMARLRTTSSCTRGVTLRARLKTQYSRPIAGEWKTCTPVERSQHAGRRGASSVSLGITSSRFCSRSVTAPCGSP